MRVLVLGGLGLVGSNYCEHALRQGADVIIIDNAARGRSCELNWHHLRDLGGDRITWHPADITSLPLLKALWDDDITHVLHCAAQSSVVRSMEMPLRDFHVNALGTVHVLECVRQMPVPAKVVSFASNKVWRTRQVPVREGSTRYIWDGYEGPGEEFPFWTDPEEPYGASKICGLYYCRMYGKFWNLPVSVAVAGGMYGEGGYGREEQGWLNWFVIATLLGLPITIYGDGKQIRDMLHCSDVCSGIDLLFEQADKDPGGVWNLSGGAQNAISLLEALEMITEETGHEPILEYREWRAADNRVYRSTSHRLRDCGWRPTVGLRDGIRRVVGWARRNLDELRQLYHGGH